MINFKGEHCETTTIGVLMTHIGFDFSEAMLFGLGQGLNYGILPWGSDGMPFLGGRTRQFEITERLCENLGLKLSVNRTASVKKAWQIVKSYLDDDRPVGLQLDCYHLEYFTSKIHFAGHFAAIIGYDDKDAYLIDTQQQGGRKKTSLESLSLARSEKGPMFGKNLSFVIDRTENEVDLREAIIKALVANAESFLNPPISNFGYKGLLRTAKDLKKWYKASDDIEKDFSFAATMMERGGTGGAMFRNLYRDFLKEASHLTGSQVIEDVYEIYVESALMWHQVSDTFMKISQTKDEKLLVEASQLFKDIEALESKAMNMLLTL
ncbi:DUF4872 domain-containing protein [Acidaminobacter sp. JC074]|uniref:BtrH N-terminal domain-containing protein n=1 Tax=Acidaminobacter sp. JC074 TaxID=2530199 RepID=UPI001F110BA1|nr:BtrH N-terminal domain-containing protein [Acidaminobacter sp. JC074]MCH4891076.1 DUF4872 domain-containing protein [Acidaminobacter sp. JC074]